MSFHAVVAEYLEAKRPEVRASTLAPIRRYLTGRYFRPLHGKPLDGITRRDIAARLVVIARENGSMSARQARAALNAFFAWALQMGLVENNPVIGAVKPKETPVASVPLAIPSWPRYGAPAATMITDASSNC